MGIHCARPAPRLQAEDELRNLLYDIFSELDDGKASKAATAQYLADMLSKQYQKEIGDNSENTIKYILEHDPYLQYIIDAIKHVTK